MAIILEGGGRVVCDQVANGIKCTRSFSKPDCKDIEGLIRAAFADGFDYDLNTHLWTCPVCNKKGVLAK